MAKKTTNPSEEEIKNYVRELFFRKYFCTVAGNIDFVVKTKQSMKDATSGHLLWAEAKKEIKADVIAMLTQLVLTIGKERPFDKGLIPPPYLGCFDGVQIAFIPYYKISDIFYKSDFNWNIAPSNKSTKEFAEVYERIRQITEEDNSLPTYIFDFVQDEKELKDFIRINFIQGKIGTSKIQIDKNNFMIVYIKWLETVKPTIDLPSWEAAKKIGIFDCHFYLADLLSQENSTLTQKLIVLLKSDKYEVGRKITDLGTSYTEVVFSPNQVAHTQFWQKYERPPAVEYWDYILERIDLLVPQDIRERRGSFFTPRIWVERSQEYLANTLGADWQDEYYIWDCAAGTGNLLFGLVNKYNIWASTLDKADVNIIHELIDKNTANLLKDQVFQFDFLNDDFSDLPKELREIIDDPEKRKKLVIYINPPYAQAGSRTTISKTGKHKDGVAPSKLKAIAKDSDSETGTLENEARELYIHFLMKVITKVRGCVLAEFSTLKTIQAPVFERFRNIFNSKLLNMFVVPANTFDNVTGEFPIGFKIWDTGARDVFSSVEATVYDHQGDLHSRREFVAYARQQNITSWISKYKIPEKRTFKDKEKTKVELEEEFMQQNNIIGFLLGTGRTCVQQYNLIYISNKKKSSIPHARGSWINRSNLMQVCTFFSIWKSITANWINDCDHFLAPNERYYQDSNFQLNCFVYALFTNAVSTSDGTNHWIPFTHQEVDARKKFESNFMSEYIKTIFQGHTISLFPDTLLTEDNDTLLDNALCHKNQRLEFSSVAKAVFNAGLKIWQYYHSKPRVNVNASLYDIRLYFNKRNEQGRMNTNSEDENFNQLDANLRSALKTLSEEIEPLVYDYGFLKG
ncbi:MAG: hypothetical protein FWG02_00180 [Holophagaceae bacterium]|nr:hypothetical protein [Holophagaceae bacterium]